jgi:site-specific DNA recombinase
VNQLFVYEIKKYIPKSEIVDLFKELIAEELSDQTNHIQDDSKQLRLQIKELQEKIVYIRELLSSKQIESADFREMKSEYSIKLEKLTAKLNTTNDDKVDIKGLLDKGVNNLLRLDYLYETADNEKKREIISSMYPEKLTFDGFTLRTNRINEVIKLIYSMDKGFSQNKKGQISKKSDLSCNVGLLGFEPRKTESKSVVLPLHHNPVNIPNFVWDCKFRC